VITPYGELVWCHGCCSTLCYNGITRSDDVIHYAGTATSWQCNSSCVLSSAQNGKFYISHSQREMSSTSHKFSVGCWGRCVGDPRSNAHHACACVANVILVFCMNMLAWLVSFKISCVSCLCRTIENGQWNCFRFGLQYYIKDSSSKLRFYALSYADGHFNCCWKFLVIHQQTVTHFRVGPRRLKSSTVLKTKNSLVGLQLLQTTHRLSLLLGFWRKKNPWLMMW